MSAFKKPLTFLKDTFVPIAPEVWGDQEHVPRETKSEEIEYIPNEKSTNSDAEAYVSSNNLKKTAIENVTISVDDSAERSSNSSDNYDSEDALYDEYRHLIRGRTTRKLTNRHVQLIGVGGTIGVSLFVNISSTLHICGPLSLVLGCIIWCIPVLIVTAACAEMVCYLPMSSPFIRFADRCIDPAFGFMVGWNFWVLQCSLLPFELTLFNSLIHYWTEDYSAAIPISLQLFVYFIINIAAVKYFGETEFWLSLSKIFLAIGLMFFVFITMVGGNPQHDAYGFRYWSTPMVPYIHEGGLGRFQGVLASIIKFSFVIAGPEYVSQIAGETINPRKVLPSAYKQVAIRLTVFFVFGSLGVGICCYYNDPLLVKAINGGAPGAGASAYTVAMHNMGIKILPAIVNAVLLTSSFSAGNSYSFCASRALYGMALEGKAPKIFAYCNKSGVPIYAMLATLAWGCLAFLQLGEQASVVLEWIINLVTAAQMYSYTCILFTYIMWRRCTIAQGIDRERLPFKAWYQPYLSYFGMFITFCMLWTQGYTVFLPGNWSVESFLFSYLMIFIDIALFIFWKVYKKTKFVRPEDADITTGLREVAFHEKILAHEEIKRGPRVKRWYEKIFFFIFY
ncbi:hypothetical protein B5S32_g3199 [[Candida] boidinii]|nr:hypothetical protein B5S32_g3199 [[Candida] boidinii]